MLHYSVLLKESLDGLNIKEDGIYVDATLGYAGHSKNILKKLSKGHLYAFDCDVEALQYSKKELEKIGANFTLFHSDFVHMKKCLKDCQVDQVDGILFDLGVSSPQIDKKERGFSFMQDGPLDMRMNRTQNFSAAQVVNEYDKKDLIDLFYSYGEEKMSKPIAEMIVKSRQEKFIETTTELVLLIKKAVGANYFYKEHPERKIFQAIRIEVNNELNKLEEILPDAISLLKKGGRLVIITFHSLEDRIVKRVFKKYSEMDEMVKGLPNIPDEYMPSIKFINKKPIVATQKELSENTRSKSAKLRIIEKVK